MHETNQVGWLLCRLSTICKSGQFKINSIRFTIKPLRTLDIRCISENNEGVTFHSFDRRLIFESLAPEVHTI